MRDEINEKLKESSSLLNELDGLLKKVDPNLLDIERTITYMVYVKMKMKRVYENTGGNPQILEQIIHLDSLINYAQTLQNKHVTTM